MQDLAYIRKRNRARAALHYHVTGAIERGEATAIVENRVDYANGYKAGFAEGLKAAAHKAKRLANLKANRELYGDCDFDGDAN